MRLLPPVTALATVAALAVAGAAHAKTGRPTPYLSEPPHPNGKSVLMIGDSNFFGPLGHVLYRELVLRGYRVSLLGKPGSGLAHPSFFNWFTVGKGLVERLRPDVVIALFGGNDGQPLTRLERGDPARLSWRDEADWDPRYERRVRELAEILRGDGREVFLLSPTNRKQPARARVERIKRLQAAAVAGMDHVHAIDLFAFSSDAGGDYLEAGVDAAGHAVAYRQRDGIHLTRAGGEVIGRALMGYLDTVFRL